MTKSEEDLRRAVVLVAVLNLAYFGVEFSMAELIGSVSLLADSIDFLEDASINFLIAVALGWTVARRAVVGKLLAGILLIPGLATLWMAWQKFSQPIPPEAVALSLTGGGALAVNVSCALLLEVSPSCGELKRAAFLSARNDAFANIAIITAGFLTAYTVSAWPDLTVGLGIALMNADAAKEVYLAARQDQKARSPMA
jgi:Co/Zn/Cd efflux system component